MSELTEKLATRLKQLRTERGLSLQQLAEQSSVSRATLSRLEKADVSPTTDVLGKLSAVYGMTSSRLLMLAEQDGAALVRRADQPIWTDPETGFQRRAVSPPDQAFAAEMVEAELPAGVSLSYDQSPKPGLEHHLVMLEGSLTVAVEGQRYQLLKGDCLRYRLFGATRFETGPDAGARYLIALV